MDWLSSRTVPVAVISQEPFLGTQQYCALLYSLFALLKRPRNESALWKWLEMWRAPVSYNAQKLVKNPQHEHHLKRNYFLNLKNEREPCCCDESCESVESRASRTVSNTCLTVSRVARCENFGKRTPKAV